MSQNGPYPGPPSHPWAGGNEEPYTEPADPHTFVPSLFSDGPGAER